MNLQRFFHASICSIIRCDRLLISFRYGSRLASYAIGLDLDIFRGNLWDEIGQVVRLLRFFMRCCVCAAQEVSCSLVIVDPLMMMFVISSLIIP